MSTLSSVWLYAKNVPGDTIGTFLRLNLANFRMIEDYMSASMFFNFFLYTYFAAFDVRPRLFEKNGAWGVRINKVTLQ